MGVYGIRSVFADMLSREKNMIGTDDYSTVEALQDTTNPGHAGTRYGRPLRAGGDDL